jgi:hypothetical protein
VVRQRFDRVVDEAAKRKWSRKKQDNEDCESFLVGFLEHRFANVTMQSWSWRTYAGFSLNPPVICRAVAGSEAINGLCQSTAIFFCFKLTRLARYDRLFAYEKLPPLDYL